MVRRRRLIAQIAFVAMLVFPGESSAFAGAPILLTATGPSPAVLSIPAGLYPLWINQDTVEHTVAFASGACTIQVAPGGVAGCFSGFSVGTHAYTIDGTTQASVVVNPAWRKVTLGGRTHTVARGMSMTLRGSLRSFVPLPSPEPPASVILLARPDRMHPFHRLAVAHPKLVSAQAPHSAGLELLWHLRVRPQARTIYIAEVNSAPQIYRRAWSKPFRVRVGR